MTDRRTDFELVAFTMGRNRNAFEALVDRYADDVTDLASFITRDRGRAQDALTETFFAAWCRIDELRDPWQLRDWILAITRHRAIAHAAAPRELPITEVAPSEEEPNVHRQECEEAWAAIGQLDPTGRAALALTVRLHLDEARLAKVLARTDLDTAAILARVAAAFPVTPDRDKSTGNLRAAVAAISGFAATPAGRLAVIDALDEPPYRGTWARTGSGFPPASPDTKPSATAVQARRGRAKQVVLAIGSALVVMVLGGIGWFVMAQADSSSAPAPATRPPISVTTAPPESTSTSIVATPTIVGVTVTPARISSTACPTSPQTATVVAVTGPGVTSATVTAALGGGSATMPMEQSAAGWSATVGPFDPVAYGSVTLRISVLSGTELADTTVRNVQLTRACI